MYQHILFAVEFGKGLYAAEEKIKQLRDKFQSKISLIHIVEMPIIDPFPEILNKEPLYIKQALDQLINIGKSLNVPVESQHVEVGDSKIIIPEYIDNHNIDLLIVGHHEKHGVYQLLGSTAHALISRAKCDVLTLHHYPAYE